MVQCSSGFSVAVFIVAISIYLYNPKTFNILLGSKKLLDLPTLGVKSEKNNHYVNMVNNLQFTEMIDVSFQALTKHL